jgi:hypothetical protein
MHSNLTKALADQKIQDLVREAEQARKAGTTRLGETNKPRRRRRFAPRFRRPAVV